MMDMPTGQAGRAQHMQADNVTIVVPTRNRPNELARLLEFLSYEGNRFPVLILDGSAAEVQVANARTAATFSFVEHQAHTPDSHLGMRCAQGVGSVATAYMVFCADDDFVFPEALAACARFLDAYPDHSSVIGNVLSLSYLKDKFLLRNGVLLGDPFRFVGYSAHAKFLQRALYFCAYSYLGTPPLYYGLRRTSVTREAFSHMNAGMKYSSMELLSNSFAFIRGKVSVLPLVFGLRDYSCPATREPMRDDPETYLAKADVEHMRPALVAALAESESLTQELAAVYVDLYLTQWRPPDWAEPDQAVVGLTFSDKVAMALKLVLSTLAPDALAAKHHIDTRTMRSLMHSQANFVRRDALQSAHR